MSMLKTKGSKMSVSEEVIYERYTEDTHGKGSKASISEEVEERYSEDTHGNCLCSLYTVIVHLHSKRII